MNDRRNIFICKHCKYADYRDGRIIFCGVCMRKILDEMQQLKASRQSKETEDSDNERRT